MILPQLTEKIPMYNRFRDRMIAGLAFAILVLLAMSIAHLFGWRPETPRHVR